MKTSTLLSLASLLVGCATVDNDPGSSLGGAVDGSGGGIASGGAPSTGGSQTSAGGVIGAGNSTGTGGASSGGASSGGAAATGGASGGASTGGATSTGGSASGGSSSGGSASGGSGTGGGDGTLCGGRALYVGSTSYAVNDEVTSTCSNGATGTVSGCVAGMRQGFRCKNAVYCQGFQPGVADGWWGGWDSVQQCP